MIPVYQQRDYDCLSACLASILEIPLANVPIFYRAYQSGYRFAKFVEKFNIKARYSDDYIPNNYYIITGYRKRPFGMGTYCHAMVGYNGQIIFDPLYDNSVKKYSKYFNIILEKFNVKT